MKKVIAFVLALVMVLSLATVAFAETPAEKWNAKVIETAKKYADKAWNANGGIAAKLIIKAIDNVNGIVDNLLKAVEKTAKEMYEYEKVNVGHRRHPHWKWVIKDTEENSSITQNANAVSFALNLIKNVANPIAHETISKLFKNAGQVSHQVYNGIVDFWSIETN